MTFCQVLLAIGIGATALRQPLLAQDACALKCSNQEAAMCDPQAMACPFSFQICMNQCEPQSAVSTGPRYDPCYLKQNAMRPCTAADMKKVAEDAASLPKGVDGAVVGTWQVRVPTLLGEQRWVWQIRENGTYEFHADGPAAPAAHSGTFAAGKGRYVLNATTVSWSDSGTYQVTGSDTLLAKGRLGSSTWQRVKARNDAPADAVASSPSH